MLGTTERETRTAKGCVLRRLGLRKPAVEGARMPAGMVTPTVAAPPAPASSWVDASHGDPSHERVQDQIPEGTPSSPRWVVAEVLSDGTVQVLDRAGADTQPKAWGSGVISGPGWTIWWERRFWG